MIYEKLSTGQQNAVTARQLATIFGCSVRDVSRQIEKERRQGLPICATCGDPPGYYQAKDAEDLAQYCDRLKSRAMQLFRTRKGLLTCLQQMSSADPQRQA